MTEVRPNTRCHESDSFIKQAEAKYEKPFKSNVVGIFPAGAEVATDSGGAEGKCFMLILWVARGCRDDPQSSKNIGNADFGRGQVGGQEVF